MKFGNVEIFKNEVSEYSGNKKVTIIPKKDIKQIYLGYGFGENRPLVSICLGVIIFCLGFISGVMPLIKILTELLNGETLQGSIVLYVWAIPLILLGTWLVFDVINRYGYFLRVVTENNSKRIPLGKKADKELIKEFVERCNTTFNYNINFIDS